MNRKMIHKLNHRKKSGGRSIGKMFQNKGTKERRKNKAQGNRREEHTRFPVKRPEQ